MSANVNLNNIISSSRSGGGASQTIGSALSWTLSNKGYSTDELSSLDKNITTVEDARLVESYCADMNNTTSKISFSDLSGVTITSYDGTATLSISSNDIVATGGAGTVYNLLLSDGTLLPLQKSCYDISGNSNHGASTDLTWSTQDSYHYNTINGCDIYLDDATSTDYIYVPYINGSPVVASIVGYTKQSSHPAGTYHNGSETKLIVGATTHDGTGWGVEQTVKDADTNEILHNSATGYGKSLGYDDLEPVFTGDYLFCNTTTDNQYKDLLLYASGDTPTFQGSISLMNYIGQSDNILTDENGEYIFDLNGYAIISEE